MSCYDFRYIPTGDSPPQEVKFAMINKIILGDCLEVMRCLSDNHFSAIVTDPPYGLSFMNKGWDKQVPGPEYWKECLRVTKPGGHIIAMGGTRTFHRLTCAIEDAGWEIRDCISWLYGSGFPKSHNHFGIEGYGTAIKPAWEPCIVAMKPCDGTFKQNAEKWGQAGINIDECRIGSFKNTTPSELHRGQIADYSPKNADDFKPPLMQVNGRWPANVILDEEAGAMLDEQSGTLIGNKGIKGIYKGGRHSNQMGGGGVSHDREYDFQGYNDSGGASRFFYCAKASASERNEGLDGFPDVIGKRTQDGGDDTRGRPIPINKNSHPTVKPLKLMEYLIKLVMPPSGGILLDPFAGSGTTILAAKNLGFDSIGIEMNPEYAEIARSRVK